MNSMLIRPSNFFKVANPLEFISQFFQWWAYQKERDFLYKVLVSKFNNNENLIFDWIITKYSLNVNPITDRTDFKFANPHKCSINFQKIITQLERA